MSNPLGSVSAISLFVEDLDAAKRFYRDVFDRPIVFEDEASAGVKLDNVFLNLLHVSAAGELVAPAPVAAPGAGARFQLSVWVEDVDVVCARLAEFGVPLLTGPEDKEWGMRAATFADPAGHSWEVAQHIG